MLRRRLYDAALYVTHCYCQSSVWEVNISFNRHDALRWSSLHETKNNSSELTIGRRMAGHKVELFKLAIYLGMPVACVWLFNRPEYLNRFAGSYVGARRHIDK
jgi:hypothetical protein